MVLKLPNTSEKSAWQFLMVKLRPFSSNQAALDALLLLRHFVTTGQKLRHCSILAVLYFCTF